MCCWTYTHKPNRTNLSKGKTRSGSKKKACMLLKSEKPGCSRLHHDEIDPGYQLITPAIPTGYPLGF